MLVIPAIDIMNGKLVRLERGMYQSQKIYYENPFDAAEKFAEHGFKLVHIVDLSGSKEGRIKTVDLLKMISSTLNIKIQFGGGIRTISDADVLFESGVDKIIVGSISVSNKNEFEKIIERYSPDRIICAVDAKDEILKIKGWTEKTDITVYEHINSCSEKGIGNFLCTDIDRDGTLTGPNIKLYKSLVKEFSNIRIVASGGVSKIEDLKKLKATKVCGIVVGKAIYENKINLEELIEFAC